MQHTQSLMVACLTQSICANKKIRLTVNPETATFDLNTEGDGYADVVLTVAVSNGTVTVGDIYNGDTKLTKTTHYTVAGGAVTLKKEYLDDLREGRITQSRLKQIRGCVGCCHSNGHNGIRS